MIKDFNCSAKAALTTNVNFSVNELHNIKQYLFNNFEEGKQYLFYKKIEGLSLPINAFTEKEMRSYIEPYLMRFAYAKVLTRKDNAYYLTFTASNKAAYSIALKRLRQLIKYIEQRAYRKKSKPENKRRWLDCSISREYQCDGTPHFHLIIRDRWGDLEKYLAFGEALQKAKLALSKTIQKNNNYKEQFPDIHLEKYRYEPHSSGAGVGNAEYYSLKEFKRIGKDVFTDDLMFNGASGVTTFNESDDRAKAAVNLTKQYLKGFWSP